MIVKIIVFLLAAATAVHSSDARGQVTATELQSMVEVAERDSRVSAAVLVVIDSNGDAQITPVGHTVWPYQKNGKDLYVNAQSRFLIASITKTFTAISVMQLLEKGKIISLDDPANKYLKRATLSDWNGTPISIRQLMTHRSGLNTALYGIIGRTTMDAPVDADFINSRIPALSHKPGSRIAYSNVGMAILGSLVEDVSGMTLADYMRIKIFLPLGMKQTELNYLATPKDGDVIAYEVGSKTRNRIKFDANNPFYAPAGSVLTSGEDMAQYLRFWLQGNEAVLTAASRKAMTSVQSRNAPHLMAIGLGPFLGQRGNTVLINHTGAFSGFTSYFAAAPQTGRAAFLVTAGSPAPGSNADPFPAYGEIADQMSDYVYGEISSATNPRPVPDADKYEGTYLPLDMLRGVLRIASLQAAQTVTMTPNGYLQLNGGTPLGIIAPGQLASKAAAGEKAEMAGLTKTGFSQNAGGLRRAGLLENMVFLIALLGGSALLLIPSASFIFWNRAAGLAVSVAPWAGLLALGVIFSALMFGYQGNDSIVTRVAEGELFRIRAINIAAWILIAGAFIFTLAGIRAAQTGKRRILWIAGVVGFSGLVFWIYLTGLADPRLV